MTILARRMSLGLADDLARGSGAGQGRWRDRRGAKRHWLQYSSGPCCSGSLAFAFPFGCRF
ncbi:hypothetical protein FOXYSP1_12416 [Fusarium oxysporum f. sp. phaseoli]